MGAQRVQLGQLPIDVTRLIKRMKIESAYFPPLEIEDPFGPGPSAVQTWGSRLKPQVTLTVEGVGPLVSAPFGRPGATKWPLVRVGAIAGGAVLGTLAILGIRSLFR